MMLNINLTPKASRNAISGWLKDESDTWLLKASVTTVPENGKANRTLLKMLAKTLKLPQSSISLINGHTNRIKKVTIETDNADVVMVRLPRQN